MSSVVENVVAVESGVVEKKVKAPKLQVKYERVYMTLFTVLNSFCIPSENEGDFVLKPEEMRKILEAVEFYSDDVKAQGVFIEENIFSKENIKSSRKSMKAERLAWKMDNGLIEKKKRGSRVKKEKVEKAPKEKVVKVPKEKVVKEKKGKKEPVVVTADEPVTEMVVTAEEPVTESVTEPSKKKASAPRKPKKKTEMISDTPLETA
jgi:outer membrane biosynthesis protein TonB